MKRYYLAPVIGDGQTPETAYRAQLPAGITGHVALIPSDAAGAPLRPWCLVLVAADAATHAAIAADPQTDPLPGIGWAESPRDCLTPAALGALAARLQARGLTAPQAVALLALPLRQIVRAIGRRLDAAFDEANFGVIDR